MVNKKSSGHHTSVQNDAHHFDTQNMNQVYTDPQPNITHRPQMATIFLDTETTGLGTLPSTEVVEVGIVDQDGNTVFHSLANPGHPIPFRASQIHGITDSMVAHAPPADEVRMRVLEVCAGIDVVIYNSAYDLKYLPGRIHIEYIESGHPPPKHRRQDGTHRDQRDRFSWAARIAEVLQPLNAIGNSTSLLICS